MKKDEVWEKVRQDKDKVYGKTMLEMFLRTTENLERRHYDQLPPDMKRLVNPQARLAIAITEEEAEEAVDDGAENLDQALYAAALGNRPEICEWLIGNGAKDFDWALLGAAHGGHLDVCKWLVGKGANDLDEAIAIARRNPQVKNFLLKAKQEHADAR